MRAGPGEMGMAGDGGGHVWGSNLEAPWSPGRGCVQWLAMMQSCCPCLISHIYSYNQLLPASVAQSVSA